MSNGGDKVGITDKASLDAQYILRHEFDSPGG